MKISHLALNMLSHYVSHTNDVCALFICLFLFIDCFDSFLFLFHSEKKKELKKLNFFLNVSIQIDQLMTDNEIK